MECPKVMNTVIFIAALDKFAKSTSCKILSGNPNNY